MSKQRVALLGLGIMGTGMARRILAAGFPLTVFNRNAEKAKPFAAEGATVAATAKEAASQADVVISMLADDTAARSVWLGESGALSGARPRTILIESSTVTVGWIKELAAAANQHQCNLLDAPVTGSKPQAAAGELTFIVGGDGAALETVRPILTSMSREIIHLGPTGSGALAKLINNFVCAVQLASIAEGLAFIEKSGLDRDRALSVMTGGAPGSPLVKAMSARMIGKDYSPKFLMRLLAKDVNYALQEASARSVDLSTARNALQLLNRAIAQGYGESDMSAIIEPLRST